MRAAIAEGGGADGVRVRERDRPSPWLGEVLVEVRAAGVNPADRRVSVGGGLPVSYPFPLGWEMSGVVRAVGPMVTRFAPGDAVCGLVRFPHPAGCYAEYVTSPARHLVAKPAALGHAEAAALPLAGLTAWQALVDIARVEPGQRVVVTAAAGGVGHLAVQLAVALGATVTGTASAAKHEFVRKLGAAEVIDYTTTDVAESEAVSGADVILDLLGGEETARLLPALRPGGTLVRVAGGPPQPIAGADGRRGVPMLVEPDHAELARLAELAAGGALKVTVTRTLPLERVAEAFELIATGHTTGKIVLEVA
ncbi:NADP-dependent oxidoreductase [Streptomyces sp. 6N223]|uniref:NADP-dependent oxidoreductase n=1 Tax=Streptomyces sp. 6N223 TaxID=3457412 RepID=UPI003FD4AD95